MIALVLRIADPNEDLFFWMDTRKEGLGGVILQNDHVICYESRKLKENDKNYPTHDL